MIRFNKHSLQRRLFRICALLLASSPATVPLSAKAASSGNDLPVTVTAEQITGRPDRQVNLDTDVVVVKGATTLQTDKAVYRIIQDEVDATGHIWMKRLGDNYTGDEGTINLESGAGYISHPTYLLKSNGGRGKAERVDFLSDEEAVINQGTYSTCEAPDPDWYLRGSSFDLDTAKDEGVMYSGVVYFKGVPILAAPVMSFPLSDQRVSGVLPPTIGTTSTGGLEVTVPYYFNIAPNRDLTLYPRMISKRGLQMGAEARYLGPNYAGQTNVEFIHDRMTQTERYSLSSVHTQALMPNLVFAWNVNKASDNDYPNDFAQSITASRQRLLTRDVSLTYTSTYWSTAARVSKYQLLQDVDNPISKPYDRVPQLTLTGSRLDVGGFDFNFNSEITRFKTDTAGLATGDRLYATPSMSYPIIRPGYYITPKVMLDATNYRLDTIAPGGQTNFTRVVPTVSVDSGLTFEREASLFGRSVTQTLEPRLFYVRTPYRDQNPNIYPVFDTGLADLNFASIFSENRFVGHDRISDANQITTGVVSRFIEESGLERLRLAAAQRFNFVDPKVLLYTTEKATTSKTDLLLSAGGQITRTLSVDNTIQYSESLAQLQRATYSARWQPAPKKVLNLTYRFDRTASYQALYTGSTTTPSSFALKQYEISGQWPLTNRWYGVGRINYSVPDKAIAEGLLGMEYKADCWVFRVAAQRIPTSTSKATTSFFVQLELNGFSKIGSNPLDALATVPGYQLINRPDVTPAF
ncbi:LPS-assembly protein LptD [Herbaspirillum sp. RTI4]|uniref:LPS-assembly protein LptD n=1 Tax=Herbaspirillum sp. RTI4 TaxID=3048640 RepID=UPI002AB456A5|nr:LPS-assembly protein LptD [Herbaspirillum sp. RTI4]MDY7576765.1 LPS-assembly protein LptD [Herbaspirillum sp. RTI4]MEA9981361.1 LPS-assembly protein LptD [Herbaspirillum sp. RTI4]